MDTTNTPAENADEKLETEAVKDGPLKLEWTKKISPRYTVIAIIVLAVLALAFYYKSVWIAATVDGHIISRISVIHKLEKQSGSSTLDTLIDNQLILNQARKQKVVATDDEVNGLISKIKTQVESQGGTLDEALKQANLSMDDLKMQMANELLLEKLLGDKVAVTDAEVDKYITDNKITIPAGQETTMRDQIKDQLKQGKVSTQATTYLSDLKLKAKIRTFVNY